MVLETPIQGPPLLLLNSLKVKGLRMILDKKLLFIEGLEGIYCWVRDTLRYHRFDIFTAPQGPYIPSLVCDFCIAYYELVSYGKKKAKTFRLVKCVVVRGK